MPAESVHIPEALRPNVRWLRLGSPQVPALVVHPGWETGEPSPVVIWLHGRTVSKELDPGRYLRWMRSGIGACALWPHAEGSARVHTRQGAATGPHRVDVDDRDGHGLTVDLELTGPQGSARAEGHVSGCPAHVERQHLALACSLRPGEGAHHSASRAREHGVHGFLACPVHRQGSAVGSHDGDASCSCLVA